LLAEMTGEMEEFDVYHR